MKKTTYENLIDLGFVLSELNGVTKRPKKRRKADDICADITIPYSNNKKFIAIPGHERLIIDVDVKNGAKGLESLQKLEDDLLIDLTRHVRTPSGGYHIYCKIDKPIRSKQKEYPGIDFQCFRADTMLCAPFVVAADQDLSGKHYEMLVDNIELEFIDSDIFALDNEVYGDDDNTFNVTDLYTKKTKEEVEQLLQFVPADEYSEWIANCAAIRRELGNTEEAFEVFHEWSKTSENYDSRESCMAKWKDLGDTPATSRSVGTIYYVATENKLNKLKSEISNSKTLEELNIAVSQNYITEYPPIKTADTVEQLSKAYKQTHQNITGKTCYLSKAKHAINKAFEINIADVVKSKVEFWTDDIVFVDSFMGNNKYFELSSNVRVTEQYLTGAYHKELAELSKASGKKISIRDLRENAIIKSVREHEYNPAINDRIFNKTLNLYNVDLRPPIAKSFTKQGLELIACFENHIFNILTEQEANIFLDYIAYLTQNFGEKINWAPVIQSVEGIGKTVLGNILIHHVFGTTNASTADINVIASGNNGWATNSALKVLEELKLSGHNRYEILNQLKPLITNPTITRVEKYEVSRDVPNVCNFIAFTNYKDALPLNDTDRRWWIAFSKISSLSELEEISGKNRNDYFAPLHELADKNSAYGPEFHLWLMNRKISSGFTPAFLPHSDHKQSIVLNEQNKIEGLVEIRDLISDGFVGVSTELLSAKQLIKMLEGSDDNGEPVWAEDIPKARQLNKILIALGYQKLERRLTFEKTRHYIWYKPTIKKDDMNSQFKKLMQSTSNIETTDFDII